MAWIARSPAPASIARAAFSGDLSESVQITGITYTIYLMLKQALDALGFSTNPSTPPRLPPPLNRKHICSKLGKNQENYRNHRKEKPFQKLYFHRFLRGS